jgi:hypothetical protein
MVHYSQVVLQLLLQAQSQATNAYTRAKPHYHSLHATQHLLAVA